VDEAMDAIERDNPSLKGVLPKQYARPALDKQRLGELIDLIGTIGLGDRENRSKDILGRIYEYFLSQFASAEGKKGGQFYTPRCVVRVLVEMLAPYKGRVFDPCCGSGGMFVQNEKFVEEHGGRIGALYRLWFSAPNMAGITYWNLADGTAYNAENKFMAGLVDKDINPKPSYRVLDGLINHDWKTNPTAKTDAAGKAQYRGFY
jgi:hypothetical protein